MFIIYYEMKTESQRHIEFYTDKAIPVAQFETIQDCNEFFKIMKKEFKQSKQVFQAYRFSNELLRIETMQGIHDFYREKVKIND